MFSSYLFAKLGRVVAGCVASAALCCSAYGSVPVMSAHASAALGHVRGIIVRVGGQVQQESPGVQSQQHVSPSQRIFKQRIFKQRVVKPGKPTQHLGKPTQISVKQRKPVKPPVIQRQRPIKKKPVKLPSPGVKQKQRIKLPVPIQVAPVKQKVKLPKPIFVQQKPGKPTQQAPIFRQYKKRPPKPEQYGPKPPQYGQTGVGQLP